MFKVKLSGLNEGSDQVVNLDGREYFKKDFKQQNEMEVNIKDQVPGIYIIEVRTGDKVLRRRIIKN